MNVGCLDTPGVDFTNVFARIFCARFSYECLFSSYVLQKTRENVGEIDPLCLFYQQFMSGYFVQKCHVQFLNTYNTSNHRTWWSVLRPLKVYDRFTQQSSSVSGAL